MTELAALVGQSQPRVSRHLKILSEAGLLDRVSNGAWVYCRARPHPLVPVALAGLSATDDALRADSGRMEVLDRQRAEEAEQYFRTRAAEWDTIRSLHVSDQLVEAQLLDAIGSSAVGDLLDVGTGTGRILRLLAGRARTAVGIDRSADMLAAARSALAADGPPNARLRLGDMNHLPLPAASIDLAVFHQVLHFADVPERALREARRVLRPTGRALVVDFASHSLAYLREEFSHRRLGFSAEDMHTWASNAALDCREVRRCAGSPLTVVIWELRPTAFATSSA